MHYFDRFYDRGPEWYSDQFSASLPGQQRGEATPNYAYRQDAWDRVVRDVPDCRLLVLLRDPVDRAYSHYLHNVVRGREDLPLADALAAEPLRLASGDQAARDHFSYVDRGRYVSQLTRILEGFSAQQLKIVLFEDLRDNPRETFTDVAAFLGVDECNVPREVGSQVNAYQRFRSLRLRNWAKRLPKPLRDGVGRLNRSPGDNYPDLPETIARQLRDEFMEERDELATLLDRDLHEWRT